MTCVTFNVMRRDVKRAHQGRVSVESEQTAGATSVRNPDGLLALAYTLLTPV